MYETGRGPVDVRGHAFIEEHDKSEGTVKATKSSKQRQAAPSKPLVVITQLPYQTNKSAFVMSVAELVEKGTLSGMPSLGTRP